MHCPIPVKWCLLPVTSIVPDIIRFGQMCFELRWYNENSALLPLQKNRKVVNYEKQGVVNCPIPIKLCVLPVIRILPDNIQFGQMLLELRWYNENSALLPLQKNRKVVNYENQGVVNCPIPIKLCVLPVITIVPDIIQFGQMCWELRWYNENSALLPLQKNR